jgi:uncharacterized protein (TIGR02145 family)/uncharacterized repeat protein (TIGR02543 family)
VSSDPGKSAYMYGEEVTITAYPANSYRFTGWSGAATGTGNPITVTMNSDKNLAANFEWQGTEPPPNIPDPTYTLTVSASPSNGGTVSTNPYKTSYNANENVYVTAEAAEGYKFVGWSSASASKDKSVTITMNGDKALIAMFEILTYTLTVSANPSNGGSVSRNPDWPNYSHGTAVTVTATANSGYRFTGWSDASTSESPGVAITMDGHKTLTANFQQITTYTVSFSANSGNGTVSSLSAQEGNSVILPDGNGLSRSGYVFGGWNTNSNGTGTNYNVSTTYTPTANTTLYAKWTLNTYTVTFNSQSGSAVSPQTVDYGGKITTPTAPTRANYTFGGWYKEATCTNSWNFSTDVVTSAITLYAKWTPITYTITYTLNSGTVSPANPASYTIETPAFTLTNPTRTGYTFAGWTGANGTAPQTAVSVPTGSTGNKSYTANWTLIAYSVTFDANGGTVATTSSTTGAGGTLASLPTPTRTGYTFNGWYTATTGGTQITTNTPFSATATIYAQWTLVTYTITFDANGGTVSPTSSTTDAGGMLTSLPTPTRTGYTFYDWYIVNINGQMVTVTTSTVFSANTTIYAQWNRIYDVFTDTRDGKSYKKVAVGDQVWMAENLDYDVEGSKCYGNSADSCAKYGRLYNWSTAMGGASSSSLSPSGVQGVCPAGWHLPSDAEWTALMNTVGGASTAGTKLKSSTDWPSSSRVPVGTNEYGFSALPGGYGDLDGSFSYAGDFGIWWSATEVDANFAWYRNTYYSLEEVYRNYYLKADLYSVRCVED